MTKVFVALLAISFSVLAIACGGPTPPGVPGAPSAMPEAPAAPSGMPSGAPAAPSGMPAVK
jgi:hypothetical protein